MGIWDKIKSVFVTGAEKAKEAGQQVADTTGEIMERAGVDKVGTAVLDAANKGLDKAAETAENVGGKVLDATNDTLTGAVDAAGKLKEKSGEWLEKAGVDKVGSAILDKAAQAKDAAADLAEKAGTGILNTANDMGNTFKNAASSAVEKAGDFYEKAQQAAALDGVEPAPATEEKKPEHAPGTIEISGSTNTDNSTSEVIEVEAVEEPQTPEKPTNDEAADVKGAEDFFDRAKRWSKGDYN